jgi:hypothetical protein
LQPRVADQQRQQDPEHDTHRIGHDIKQLSGPTERHDVLANFDADAKQKERNRDSPITPTLDERCEPERDEEFD